MLLRKVQEIAEEALEQGVGSALGIGWHHQGLAETLTLGQTALEPFPHQPVTAQTPFDLASLTKPMATVTLLAQELTKERLNLQDRLDQHLPLAIDTALGPRTLGQLLSHTSGAVAWRDFALATQELNGQPRIQAVQQLVLNTPLETEPGTQATYSDLGFLALGWLLEEVTQLPLDQLFAERVARPLGLTAQYRRLSLSLDDALNCVATEIWPQRQQNLPLQGQVHDDNAAALDGVAGHAGLFATVSDVLQWSIQWLHLVQGQETPLEIAPLLAHMLVTTPGCPHTSWRHGWDTPTQPGSSAGQLAPQDAFGHLGFTGTSVWLSPQRDAAGVLLTNRVHPTRESVQGIRALRPRLYDALWRNLSL